MTGISEAFYEAVQTIAAVAKATPLPSGLTQVEAGEWDLSINVSKTDIEKDGFSFPPYTVIAQHRKYLIISAIGPDGGMIGGGMTEGEFIQQMKTLRADPNPSPQGPPHD
jgi:hypothetical protein